MIMLTLNFQLCSSTSSTMNVFGCAGVVAGIRQIGIEDDKLFVVRANPVFSAIGQLYFFKDPL